MAVDNNILQVQALLDKVNETLNEQITLYNTLAETTNKYGSAKSTTPSSIINIQKETEAVNASIEKTRLAEIRLQQAREKAFDKYEIQLTKEQAKLQASQTLYSKLGQKLALLRAEYSELAVKQQLRGRLSDEEAKRLDFLTQKTQKYVMAQDAVNTTMGKYQQRVGAYGGQFNSLGNSINQLTREMPAFTYSVQTGFMALSNNIPIFSDAIGNAIKQNKALQAEGKPTTSVLSQVAGALLSWQTLMGVGITLLTVYGKEIGDWISSMSKASKTIDVQKESQKALNEASTLGAKNAVEETLKVRSLLEIAKDMTLTYQQRMIAVKELQDTYPAYFGNLTKEKILAGETTQAEKELTDAILSRAKANAAIGKITENQAKIIDIEIERLNLRKEVDVLNKKILSTEKALQNSDNVTNSQGIALSQMYDKRASLISKINKLSGEKYRLDQLNKNLTDSAIEKQKEAIPLDYKQEKSKKDNTEGTREQIEAIELHKHSVNSLIVSLENEIKFYEELRDKATNTSKEFVAFDKIVKALKSSLDLMKDPSKYLKGETDSLKISNDLLKKHAEGWEAIQKAMDNYSNRFVDSFISNSGFKTTFDILSDKILGFGSNAKVTTIAVMESFQEMYNFISEASNRNFEAEFNNLERKKNIALAFAGDSETARTEIERQAEQRRKEIAKREFETKKQQALFNIAIDTAQAIMATLGKTGFLGIPLTFVVGAIGLAQAAVVASQQPPEFWEGGIHEGGLLKMNDDPYNKKGGNYKEVALTPDGKVYKPQGKNVVANFPKGTEIFKDYATFDAFMFNQDLSNMMQSAGIGMSDSKPQIDIRQDLHQLGKDVVSAINNKTEYHQTFDNNGINNYISNGHTRKQIKNNHVTFTKQSY